MDAAHGRRGCAVFCALLTYCLLGTSGLGLQTVPLFVSTALQNVCFLQKGTKIPYSLAPPRRPSGSAGLGSASPGQPQRGLSQPRSAACAHEAWALAGGLLGRQPAPVLKAAEPPWLGGGHKLASSFPAGVSLPSLETGTPNARAWLISPRELGKILMPGSQPHKSFFKNRNIISIQYYISFKCTAK